MKKLLVCFMVATISNSSINPVFNVQHKIAGALVAIQNGFLSALSYVREPNSVKIEKALQAHAIIQKAEKGLRLDLNDENSLWYNIQQLGFEKSNALAALHMIEKYQSDLKVLVDRYDSVLTPWNKTYDMQQAVEKISTSLQICQACCGYLKKHKDCLRGFELVHHYQKSGILGGVTDANIAVSVVSAWYKNNDLYSLVKSIDLLSLDLEFIQSCLMKNSFKQLHPDLYGQLYYYVPMLHMIKSLVVATKEYKSQMFCKNHKQMQSSAAKNNQNQCVAVLPAVVNESTESIVNQAVVASFDTQAEGVENQNIEPAEEVQVLAVENTEALSSVQEETCTLLIEQMNPFNDYSLDNH